MSGADMAAAEGVSGGGHAYLSIGEVLRALKSDFADVSISKIRFLESAGLVTPERAPSGYRRFSHRDVERLRYVLHAQRDRYLPLRVIREQLHAMDRGLTAPPEKAGVPSTPVGGVASTPAGGMPSRPPTGGSGFPASDFTAGDLRLTRSELLSATGLDEQRLSALEQFGLILPRAGRYDEAALAAARATAALAKYGVEPRHLRGFRSSADREVALFEQVLTPIQRGRSAEAKAQAGRAAAELAATAVALHAALLRTLLRGTLPGGVSAGPGSDVPR